MGGTVSIIIPVYNRVQLLHNALLSLSHQSFLPDEIIISDDGSQEDILGNLKNWLPNIPVKIKYVCQEDKGFRAGRCRNNAVRISTGDYLIFTDQDLIMTKNYIRTLVENRKPNQFCVAYPVRLTMEQTEMLNDEAITSFDFDHIITPKQFNKIKKQYRKDYFYYLVRKWKLRSRGPKLRGGAVGINREDYIKINGYDEKYVGWGYEDDDVGRRLNRINVIGKNVSYHDFPIHMYHDPFHVNGERVNRQYHRKNLKEINGGRYRAEIGFSNPEDEDEAIVVELN